MANFCRKCGFPLEAGNRFCTNCGEPIDRAVPSEFTHTHDSGESSASSKDNRDAARREPRHAAAAVHQGDQTHHKMMIGVIIAAAAVIALIGLLASGVFPRNGQVPITFHFKIDDHFTKDSTPIVVQLIDQHNKDKVIDESIDVSNINNPTVNVPEGVYAVRFISPINADGSIYLTNDAVKVDTAAKDERTIDAEFTLVEAKQVTEAQLQGIVDELSAANKNGGVSDETVKMANERVSKKKEEVKQQTMAIDEEAIYADLIKTYAVGVLDNYDTPQLKQLDMSPALAPALTDPKDSYGYALIDLDGDGIREMITGHVDDKGQTTYGDIYDMYTIQNNKPLHVLSSTDRTRWYYCGKGQIYKVQATGTSHNGENATLYYLCKPNATLDLIEGVENTGITGVSSYYIYENGAWKDVKRSETQQKIDYFKGLRKDYSMIPFKK